MQPLNFAPDAKGKVRDIYDLGDRLLLVASDRISAFDFVLSDPIPFKGEILTRLSLFWFDFFKDVIPTHFLSADTADLPLGFAEQADYLRGRFMLVKKANVFPIECIVRGYLAGSGLKEYQKSGTLCGIELPEGLVNSSKFEAPLFTPSTKAEIGDHDENISFDTMVELLGEQTAVDLRDAAMTVYTRGRDHAAARGIIIADTKFEFGLIDGKLTLIDEVLTPDSSRFWPADSYAPGRNQASFDKQYVRDWLESTDWDRVSQPPSLPADVIETTSKKYIQAYETITGTKFVPQGVAQ
ncbi:MAG: phosphoribosylaminoimidazolesuccinocarboxamide synthase [Coriobacteriia bacterium]|nr:phosphoribosylaminoimidazolesuccinocarboxamide synthase [Coriobacteriia bacterium]